VGVDDPAVAFGGGAAVVMGVSSANDFTPALGGAINLSVSLS
jgi:hypothetical protein